MSNDAGALLVKLGLDSVEFTSGMAKAEYMAGAFIKQMGAAFGGMAQKLGIALSVAGVVAYTKHLVDAADEMYHLSLRTQMTVEDLGGLGLAAEKSGSSLEAIAFVIGRLNVKIGQAQDGTGEAAKSFKAMGIDLFDANHKAKDAVQVFAEMADKFKSYAEGGAKAALAQGLIGRSYQNLLPLFQMGSAGIKENIEYYKRFGGTTTETAKAANKFNDVLVDMNFVIAGSGRAILRELLDPLKATADAMKELAEHNAGRGFASIFAAGFQAVAVVAATLFYGLEKIGLSIGTIIVKAEILAVTAMDVAMAVKRLSPDDLAAALTTRAAAIKDIEFSEKIDKLKAKIGYLNYLRDLLKLEGGPPKVPQPGDKEFMGPVEPLRNAPGTGDEAAKVKKAADDYLTSLENQIVATYQLTASQKILYDLELDRRKIVPIEGMTPELRRKAEAIAATLKQAESEKLLLDVKKQSAKYEEELAEMGKTAYEKALLQAERLRKEEVVPREDKLKGLEGKTTKEALADQLQLRKEIDAYTTQGALLVGKASAQELSDLTETTKKMTEEVAVLGMDTKARLEYNNALLETRAIRQDELATNQSMSEEGQKEAERLRAAAAELRKQKTLETEKVTKTTVAEQLKATQDEVLALMAGNTALSEEVALLGLDAEARQRYSDEMLQNKIMTLEVLAASQLNTEEGNKVRAGLEKEIVLLKEKRSLLGIKSEKENILDIKEKADAASQTMSESIADGIMKGFREGTSFADIFLRELQAQFARTILTPIIQPIVMEGNNFLSGLLKDLSGYLGLGGSSGGGAGAPSGTYVGGWNTIPTAAGGGSAAPNTLFRVNEGRMEALRLNGEQFLLTGAGGGVIDSAPRIGGGGVTIIQNNQFGSNISRNEVANAAKMANATAKAEILRSIHLNGAFSGA